MYRIRILLVDNGSLAPAATLALRNIALELSRTTGYKIHPISVMHSAKIDPALLGGMPASTFKQALRQAQTDGINEIFVLPLFIGPSLAITEYLPKLFTEAHLGSMKLTVMPTLFGENGSELIPILCDNLKSTDWIKNRFTVLLCDHGSPIPEVTKCRDILASSLRRVLKLADDELVACSMERRDGPEYRFNEPMLSHAIQSATKDVIILMLFLLPGRHAGPNGDVANIAQSHIRNRQLWQMSPLIGSHPELIELLKKRLSPVHEYDRIPQLEVT